MATALPAATPPLLATAAADIILAATDPAVMPVAINPSAQMPTGMPMTALLQAGHHGVSVVSATHISPATSMPDPASQKGQRRQSGERGLRGAGMGTPHLRGGEERHAGLQQQVQTDCQAQASAAPSLAAAPKVSPALAAPQPGQVPHCQPGDRTGQRTQALLIQRQTLTYSDSGSDGCSFDFIFHR